MSSHTVRHQDAAWDARELDPSGPRPTFFIVGAAKAGTTSLHAYLDQHPDVFMSKLKEPHFFASFERTLEFDNYLPVVRDPREYQELFKGSTRSKAVGEASPSYLCDPHAARRIKSAIPDAKIIISLRNPIQRAFSHYLMEYHEGKESRAFCEALDFDAARKSKGWGVSFQYFELGLYADQVRRFIEVFGRERVLVILFEGLVRSPVDVMCQIADFLSVDPALFPAGAFKKAHNPFEESRGVMARVFLRSRRLRRWAKKYLPHDLRTFVRNKVLFSAGRKPEVDPAIRLELASRYESDLIKLEQLLGRNLDELRERS